MLSNPVHTTCKLQLLDRTFMKSLKGAHDETCSSWMKKNPAFGICTLEQVL